MLLRRTRARSPQRETLRHLMRVGVPCVIVSRGSMAREAHTLLPLSGDDTSEVPHSELYQRASIIE